MQITDNEADLLRRIIAGILPAYENTSTDRVDDLVLNIRTLRDLSAKFEGEDPTWTVHVGNVGNIVCRDARHADEVFRHYADQSAAGYGAAAWETVELTRDGVSYGVFDPDDSIVTEY
jgi:hypothetical protein